MVKFKKFSIIFHISLPRCNKKKKILLRQIVHFLPVENPRSTRAIWRSSLKTRTFPKRPNPRDEEEDNDVRGARKHHTTCTNTALLTPLTGSPKEVGQSFNIIITLPHHFVDTGWYPATTTMASFFLVVPQDRPRICNFLFFLGGWISRQTFC